MCRNIKPLFNYDPPATADEIEDAARQYVRKISGYRTPSKANEAAFEQAVDEIATATRRMLDALVTRSPSRDRDAEAARARARSQQRFAGQQ